MATNTKPFEASGVFQTGKGKKQLNDLGCTGVLNHYIGHLTLILHSTLPTWNLNKNLKNDLGGKLRKDGL